MKGTVFVILAMFLSVLPAFAQDWQTKATVIVPFEFSVNHKVFPAGDYEILTPGKNLLFLKNV